MYLRIFVYVAREYVYNYASRVYKYICIARDTYNYIRYI